MLRVERKLQAFEQKHSLLHHWVPSSSEYQVVKSTMESRRKSKLCAKVQHLAREWWFLLSMKTKHTGMLQFDLSLNIWYSGDTATTYTRNYVFVRMLGAFVSPINIRIYGMQIVSIQAPFKTVYRWANNDSVHLEKTVSTWITLTICLLHPLLYINSAEPYYRILIHQNLIDILNYYPLKHVNHACEVHRKSNINSVGGSHFISLVIVLNHHWDQIPQCYRDLVQSDEFINSFKWFFREQAISDISCMLWFGKCWCSFSSIKQYSQFCTWNQQKSVNCSYVSGACSFHHKMFLHDEGNFSLASFLVYSCQWIC